LTPPLADWKDAPERPIRAAEEDPWGSVEKSGKSWKNWCYPGKSVMIGENPGISGE
jgi:hypothetical protein